MVKILRPASKPKNITLRQAVAAVKRLNLDKRVDLTQPIYDQVKRLHDFDWDEFPVISGQGSLHDLSPNEEELPRLAFARSVSINAARALNHKPQPVRRPVGFHLPTRR